MKTIYHVRPILEDESRIEEWLEYESDYNTWLHREDAEAAAAYSNDNARSGDFSFYVDEGEISDEEYEAILAEEYNGEMPQPLESFRTLLLLRGFSDEEIKEQFDNRLRLKLTTEEQRQKEEQYDA